MVNPAVLSGVFAVGEKLLDRWFPNGEERAKAERDFLMAMREQDMRAAISQLEVNAREAAHPSVWVAGWRPFIGWASGAGFLWATIGQPVLTWASVAHGWPAPPAVDSDVLLTVMFGMLGLGTLRSVEKVKGAAK